MITRDSNDQIVRVEKLDQTDARLSAAAKAAFVCTYLDGSGGYITSGMAPDDTTPETPGCVLTHFGPGVRSLDEALSLAGIEIPPA